MRRNIPFKDSYAVSELVGGLILIVIAILAFSVISLYMFPKLDPIDDKVELRGYVTDDGNAVIEHIGGKSLTYYKVQVFQVNGGLIDSEEYRGLDPPWSIGQCKYPLEDMGFSPLINETDMIEIVIFTMNSEGNEQEIFRGILQGSPKDIFGSKNPILISSLRDNSPDEDLICYSYPVIPDINATTYIYNWKKNGVTISDLNMPFNTENNVTCKDYSGHGLIGTLNGVTWIPEGIIGGAYYFPGSSKYISVSLPNVFYDIPNNDFTVSIWVSSQDVAADNAVILMASKDNNNFVKFFLYGSEIHIGICDNGLKDAVRTEDIENDTWYHIVGVWDASEDSIVVYCNGNISTLPGERTFALGAGTGLLEIGHATASSKFWKGHMDELEIYDRALTQAQIYQIYLSTNDGDYTRRVIVSEETSLGSTWQCVVTPNDGIQDGTPIQSNILKIVNYSGGD